jgi:hypothetical protein
LTPYTCSLSPSITKGNSKIKERNQTGENDSRRERKRVIERRKWNK